jgi:hypothetical protein
MVEAAVAAAVAEGVVAGNCVLLYRAVSALFSKKRDLSTMFYDCRDVLLLIHRGMRVGLITGAVF